MQILRVSASASASVSEAPEASTSSASATAAAADVSTGSVAYKYTHTQFTPTKNYIPAATYQSWVAGDQFSDPILNFLPACSFMRTFQLANFLMDIIPMFVFQKDLTPELYDLPAGISSAPCLEH
jgi:hypothetical protein